MAIKGKRPVVADDTSKAASTEEGDRPSGVVPADPDDTIAHNRTLAIEVSSAVTKPPAGYRATKYEVRRRRLRQVHEGLRAEFKEALAELAAAGPALKKDLGDLAPDIAPIGPLLARLGGIEDVLAELRATVRAYEELEDIALGDGQGILQKAHRYHQARADDVPGLAARYPKLRAYAAAKGSAIAAGIAASRAEEARVEEARAEGAREAREEEADEEAPAADEAAPTAPAAATKPAKKPAAKSPPRKGR